MKQMEQYIPVEPKNEADREVLTKNEIQFFFGQKCKGGFDTFIEKYAKPLKEYLENKRDKEGKPMNILEEYRKNPEQTLQMIKEDLNIEYPKEEVLH